MFSRFLFLVVIGITSSLPALASYLTIGGVGELKASVVGEHIQINGLYSITNTGDEAAHRVFPAFSLGKWSFSGEPRTIGVNGKEDWTIHAEIDPHLVAPEGGPLRGLFPVLVRRHYEDANGAKFSAADVELLPVGDLSDKDLGMVRTPQISSKLTCDGNGESFTCDLNLLNDGATPLLFNLSYHTSMELQATSDPLTLNVPAHGNASTSFRLKNFSGLIGSSYGVFAVLRWDQDGLKMAEKVGAVVSIAKPSYRTEFSVASILIFLLAAASLYYFVFKNKSGRF